MFNLLQIMGEITSVCCQSDNKPQDTKKTIELCHQKPTPHFSPKRLQQKESVESNFSTFESLQTSKKHPPIQSLGKSPKKQNLTQTTSYVVAQEAQPQFPAAAKSKTPKKQKQHLRWKDFIVSYRLGGGSFGQVFLGELKRNKLQGIVQKYVIKRIELDTILYSRLPDEIQLQKKILLESRCKFITKMRYSFRDQLYFYIVMEWASGGDTFSLIRKTLPDSKIPNPRLPLYKRAGQQAVRFILASLILGLEYLHSKNIVYRDLKPENLLIFSDGYLKLADFGLAKQLKQTGTTRTFVGTPVYYAPEIILRAPYGKEVDLWSL